MVDFLGEKIYVQVLDKEWLKLWNPVLSTKLSRTIT